MHSRSPVFVAVILIVWSVAGIAPGVASAEDHEGKLVCPKEISFIEHLPVAVKYLSVLQKIYDEVGCHTTVFTPYPGRRSVVLFNAGKIDGQFARLKMIEQSYTRSFLRSEAPINRARAILWERKDIDPTRNTPLGYTIGVKWQDNYVSSNQHVRGFESPAGKIEAFENRVIDRFIETDQNIRFMREDGILKTAPVLKEVLLNISAYHYVGAEFGVFMDRFNKAMAARSQTNAVANVVK